MEKETQLINVLKSIQNILLNKSIVSSGIIRMIGNMKIWKYVQSGNEDIEIQLPTIPFPNTIKVILLYFI